MRRIRIDQPIPRIQRWLFGELIGQSSAGDRDRTLLTLVCIMRDSRERSLTSYMIYMINKYDRIFLINMSTCSKLRHRRSHVAYQDFPVKLKSWASLSPLTLSHAATTALNRHSCWIRCWRPLVSLAGIGLIATRTAKGFRAKTSCQRILLNWSGLTKILPLVGHEQDIAMAVDQVINTRRLGWT